MRDYPGSKIVSLDPLPPKHLVTARGQVYGSFDSLAMLDAQQEDDPALAYSLASFERAQSFDAEIIPAARVDGWTELTGSLVTPHLMLEPLDQHFRPSWPPDQKVSASDLPEQIRFILTFTLEFALSEIDIAEPQSREAVDEAADLVVKDYYSSLFRGLEDACIPYCSFAADQPQVDITVTYAED